MTYGRIGSHTWASMHAGVLQGYVAEQSVGMGHGVRNAVPDSKLSDKMAWPIIPLKVATGQAPLLESQHLIILVLARDICKPGLQGGACTNMGHTLVLLVWDSPGDSLAGDETQLHRSQGECLSLADFVISHLPDKMPVCNPHKPKGCT